MKTKRQVCAEVAKGLNLSQAKVNDVVDAVLAEMMMVVAKEGYLEWRSFGIFEVRRKRDGHLAVSFLPAEPFRALILAEAAS